MLKKTVRITGILLLVMTIISLSLFFIYDEELPQGEQSARADSLATEILTAINHEAYKNTRFLEFTFVGHHYRWDKQLHEVDVSWDNYVVHLHPKAPEKSTVKENNEIVKDAAAREEIVTQAVNYFNNDSFWLVAPHKVFDPGTERRLINLEDGEQALLVTYTSGGNTPGDSYLWLLDDAGRPKAWKMWVSILPVGGLKTMWNGWEKTQSGTWLPTWFQLFFFELEMDGVRGWN